MDKALVKIHEDLNIDKKYITNYKLALTEQPPLEDLRVVKVDFEGKPFILASCAADPWFKMCQAAESDGVFIEPYSGFRSYLYQKQLIKIRLAEGRPLELLITQVAIPGFSEHHSGLAVDICAKGRYTLEEDFEQTNEFAWLKMNAKKFNFEMSYPRDNAQNIIYEPWHWCYKPQ